MDKVTQILQEIVSPKQVFWKTTRYPYFLLIWKYIFSQLNTLTSPEHSYLTITKNSSLPTQRTSFSKKGQLVVSAKRDSFVSCI